MNYCANCQKQKAKTKSRKMAKRKTVQTNKYKNKIDGRPGNFTDRAFNLFPPILHNGSLLPNGGWVKVKTQPKVSKDTQKILEDAITK